jgi:hypothetical protein
MWLCLCHQKAGSIFFMIQGWACDLQQKITALFPSLGWRCFLWLYSFP